MVSYDLTIRGKEAGEGPMKFVSIQYQVIVLLTKKL